MKDQSNISMIEKSPIKVNESNAKYQNINPATNRSNILVQEEPNHRIEGGQMVKPIVESGPIIIQGKPMQLQLRPMILQNPQVQLFNPISNFTVCPYCKYSGGLDISYTNSSGQKNCCLVLVLLGLCCLAWIPFLVKDLSVQILKEVL